MEKCFVIRIGLDLERDSEGIDHVIEAQTELCRTSEDFVLVSTQAVTLNDRGMMQDRVHYTQEGYKFHRGGSGHQRRKLRGNWRGAVHGGSLLWNTYVPGGSE